MALDVYAEVNVEITAEMDRAESGLHETEATIRARPDPQERAAWLEQLVSGPFQALDQVPANDLNAALRGAGIRIYCEENQVKVIGFAVS